MTPSTPIETIDQLKEYLQVAMQLEHATIPPYLTAAYTAKLEGNKPKNKDARDAILAVAREEMLHLTLAGNMLNAIGGTPNLLRDGFVPTYPCHLPDGETDFEVSIASFSATTIDNFLHIERPNPPNESRKAAAVVTEEGKVRGVEPAALAAEAPEANSLLSEDGKIKYIEKKDLRHETRGQGRGLLPAVTVESPAGVLLELHYWCIGEFYNAIRNGFVHLAAKPEPLFTGDKSRQIPPPRYFSAGGKLTKVTDLPTALAAIDLISSQGEGYTDEINDIGKELAHYYRFEEIQKGRYYLKSDRPHHPRGGPLTVDFEAVYPIKRDGKVADYKNDPIVQQNARMFNGLYRGFLGTLNDAFNGHPDFFEGSYAGMFQIRDAMDYLVRNEIAGTGENAAPTFEMNECIDPPANWPKEN